MSEYPAIRLECNEAVMAVLSARRSPEFAEWVASTILPLIVIEMLEFCSRPETWPVLMEYIRNDATLDDHFRKALLSMPREMIEQDFLAMFARGIFPEGVPEDA